jgi:hypothetical protein
MEGVVGHESTLSLGNAPDLQRTERHTPIFSIQVCRETGTRMQMQA